MSIHISIIPQLRRDLAGALGFTEYQATTLAEPYLNYIENRHTGDGSMEAFLRLFIQVLQHFQDNESEKDDSSRSSSTSANQSANGIQTFIDSVSKSATEPYFVHTTAGSTLRMELVTDTILYILGIWVAMLSYFVKLPAGYRQIELAYYMTKKANPSKGLESCFAENLPELLKGSGLLPSPRDGQGGLTSISVNSKTASTTDSVTQTDNFASQCHVGDLPTAGTQLFHTRIDSLESLSIRSSALNAYTLTFLGGLRIHWTINLSRHLLLSRFAGRDVLEVFALPCILQGGAKSLRAAGIPSGLIHEVQESYSILFNATGDRSTHNRLVKTACLRWLCWCRACSLHRLRNRELDALRRSKHFPVGRRPRRNPVKSEFDPLLEELMKTLDPEDWSYELFPHLWNRIVTLEEHLGNAKPWNFWVLLRDRRDTLQFWTFFFGTVILVLTVAQVALGAAQVAGAF